MTINIRIGQITSNEMNIFARILTWNVGDRNEYYVEFKVDNIYHIVKTRL